MAEAISDTSVLFYLHQIGALDWLAELFTDVWVPRAVVAELEQGAMTGHDVPNVSGLDWVRVVDPHVVPSRWLAADLGRGELAVLSLALENPQRVVLLDDELARHVARSAGLKLCGTLRILVESKKRRLTPTVAPLIARLRAKGMWISEGLSAEVLALAGEIEGTQ